MGKVRVQVLLDETEKTLFQDAAEREQESLGGWLRRAAHERLAARRPPSIASLEELREFFRRCDAREGSGREPDWEQHQAVIAASRARGASDS